MAFDALTRRVFGAGPRPDWQVAALFEEIGDCAGGLSFRLQPLMLDGAIGTAALLALVVVDERWRGLGLMRELMDHALRWCDARAPLVLLYAETPELYARHGFGPVAQHAFVGPAPAPFGTISSRRLDPRAEARLVARLAAGRTPLSLRCAFLGGDGDYATRLAADDGWRIAYSEGLDALIVHEADADGVTLVDVVAPAMPTAAQILGALGRSPRRLTTLFPPDRLDWSGEPVRDDTGLMHRGPLPAAMRRPFMLPPTAEF